jgi:hypothetical protein
MSPVYSGSYLKPMLAKAGPVKKEPARESSGDRRVPGTVY